MSAAAPAWRAYIVGESAVIDRLVALFADTDLEVARDGERAYLHGRAFDGATTISEVLTLAQSVLPRVNAALRLDDVTWAPITLAGRISDGAGPATVFAEAHMVGRSKITVGGDPGPHVRAAALAHANADAGYRAALELFGSSPELKWVDLYKVYELLLDAAAGDLPGRAGIPANQISAFTASANDAAVSGADARHAIAKKQPPRRTMTLAQGRHFVSTMLRSWT